MTDEERESGEPPEEEGGLYDELAGDRSGDALPEAQTPAPSAPAAAPPGSGNHRRIKRAKWPWIFLGLLVAVILLIGWTKTVNSDSFCTRCHSMQAAADTAAHSVHSDVSCISCHRGVGIQGAVSYIPTFLREVVDQLTPIPLAKGTMDAAPCESCHDTIFTSPLLKGEHPDTGCDSCHGNTTHPQPPAPPEPISNPHPADWIDYHGREANRDLNTCATCHLLGDQNGSGTCMACHFKAQYPHPKGWINQHGQASIEAGPDACTLCHSSETFCAGCHGTEIPHPTDWLSQHPQEVIQKDNKQQCLMCHARSDCTFCHVRHAIHPEQGLYYEVKP